ncbi:unnamed protein product, partial [Ectocarpus sp. 12 AP-2014]
MIGKAFGIAVALAATASPRVRAEQVLVASLVDDITYADIVPSGTCADGCVRYEQAVAHVTGTPDQLDCDLQTVSPFDSSTPEPGLLRALIYCEDSSGTLIEQGTRPCVFDVCVDFSWSTGDGDGDGELTYEYNGTCEVQTCEAPNAYGAVISMTDEYGDGWVGGVDGYYNTWQLTDLTTDTVWSKGTLADNHESATIKECLADGEYMFNTTATSAFADDMGWGICDNYGAAGEGLKFTVLNGACDGESAELIARATAEETSDAEDSYCILPAPESDEDYRTSTCTALSSGMKIDGVGLFYDDRCNSADYSGCFARSIPACRLCFWDKDLWMSRFPSSRVPDWELCPCCVADTLGIDCASGGGGGTDEGVIIGISVGIAGVIAIACCLSCAFGPTIVRFLRRMRKKKHAEDQLDLDGHPGTSAFPDSPGGGMGGGGNTLRGAVLTHGNRDRGRSGHFPIPRFDSIRGRFDSGIFASNVVGGGGGGAAAAGGVGAGAHVGGGGPSGELEKISAEQANASTTAQSTPSGANGNGVGTGGGGGKAGNAPRSTVLDGRLVAQGYTTTDMGRPTSSGSSRAATAAVGEGS